MSRWTPTASAATTHAAMTTAPQHTNTPIKPGPAAAAIAAPAAVAVAVGMGMGMGVGPPSRRRGAGVVSLRRTVWRTREDSCGWVG